MTDGGIVVGFRDEAWSRPADDSRRLWAVEKPTLNKKTPSPSFDDIVFGFCALNRDSVVESKDDPGKESVSEFPTTSARRSLSDQSSSFATTFSLTLLSV